MQIAPWVSCVIPCHNDGATLERAVASVLDQGVPVEVIVIDDASTDGSAEVAESLARRHAGVRLCRNRDNCGASASRNTAARAASAEYLCFLDADDEHLPGFYQLACMLLDDHAEWAAVKGGVEYVGVPPEFTYDESDPRHAMAEFSCLGNLMLRREVFGLLNGFPADEVFRHRGAGEDVVFMMALSRFISYFEVARRIYRYYYKPQSHLRTFLERTRVVEGRVEWLQLLPEEDDGSLKIAYERYVAALDLAAIRCAPYARQPDPTESKMGESKMGTDPV